MSHTFVGPIKEISQRPPRYGFRMVNVVPPDRRGAGIKIVHLEYNSRVEARDARIALMGIDRAFKAPSEKLLNAIIEIARGRI